MTTVRNPNPLIPIGIAALCCCFSAGCGRNVMSIARPKTPMAIVNSYYTADQYKADMVKYDAETDPTVKKARRNDITWRLMADIDDYYGRYTAAVFSGKGTQGVLGDALQLGLTAASTIASPVATKTIYSALATAVGGVNLSVDKNFFAQQSFQVLAVAMQARRDAARVTLEGHLESDDTYKYPFERARRDLISYFNAGTLTGGLQQLQEQAGKAANDTKSVDGKQVSLH